MPDRRSRAKRWHLTLLIRTLTFLRQQLLRMLGALAPTQFACATIERWYLAERNARQDRVAWLRRKIRKDAGRRRSGASLESSARRLLSSRVHRSWCRGYGPEILHGGAS